jgi:glucosyl-3-phosphoglycerate phosphatase
VRLFVLARHAESTLNHQNRINGDPSVPADLTDAGRAQAMLLGQELSGVSVDFCVHTRFGRTRVTAKIALEGHDVEFREEPLLDDIDVGDLEGWTVDDYRTWKRAHTRGEPFPGGESLDDAARRYARGFRAVLDVREDAVLVVTHEIPIRYALNAAGGSDDLDAPAHAIPNARPYLFDEPTLERAAVRIEELAGKS